MTSRHQGFKRLISCVRRHRVECDVLRRLRDVIWRHSKYGDSSGDSFNSLHLTNVKKIKIWRKEPRRRVVALERRRNGDVTLKPSRDDSLTSSARLSRDKPRPRTGNAPTGGSTFPPFSPFLSSTFARALRYGLVRDLYATGVVRSDGHVKRTQTRAYNFHFKKNI